LAGFFFFGAGFSFSAVVVSGEAVDGTAVVPVPVLVAFWASALPAGR
jgi:hypothetical protein